MRSNKLDFATLTTPFEKDHAPYAPYSMYPRPLMVRESYLSLNGSWDFTVINGSAHKFEGKITVPFPPESKLSGVLRSIQRNDVMVYSRSFTIPDNFNKGSILLHLDAVDQTFVLKINGNTAGTGALPYLPHTFDITALIRDGDNEITVSVIDNMDTDYPYGKQTAKRGGMWYTKISGIWQSVWLESVPEKYIEKLLISADTEKVKLSVVGGEEAKTLSVATPYGVEEYSFLGDGFEFSPKNPRLWSPEDPNLYYFTLKCGEDEVKSYFAMRTCGITEKNGMSLLALNGKPYYLHGVLDQGYFSDGIFLPATPEGFLNDILKMKACGFNMLRKHIKLEPQLFYYYCDKHGMIVCQDLINSGKYSFLIDTALPTVGPRHGISHRASEKSRKLFFEVSDGIVERLRCHPSVCYYTVFNEGWGQFDAGGCYKHFKALDSTRVWDTTSGWFKTKHTDVESDHVYFKKIKLKNVKGRPMVLSEFGGYSCRIDGHTFNLTKNYGYRICKTAHDFERDLTALYENEIIPHAKEGLCCSVLTQLSDVEDETNGLLTYDRQVLKISPKRMRKISDEVFSAFCGSFGGDK
ncbi:MAG: glycoside hydrolase family 2 [Clostridia bacterium]|nr:glycoside hydrolase family 2 [Clostridia bacterium]